MIVAILLLLFMIGSIYVYEDVKELILVISVILAAFTMLSVQEDAQLSTSGTTLNYRRGSVPSYLVTHYSRYP